MSEAGGVSTKRLIVEEDKGTAPSEGSDQRKELKGLRGVETLEEKLRRLQQSQAGSSSSNGGSHAVTGGETLAEKMARLKLEQEQRKVASTSSVKQGYEAVESIAEKMKRLQQGSNTDGPVSPRKEPKSGYEAVESLQEKMARLKQEQDASAQQQRSPRKEVKAGYEAVETLQEKMAKLKQDQESSTQRSPRGETKAGYEAMSSVAEKMKQLKQESSAVAVPSATKSGYEASNESLSEKLAKLKQQQQQQQQVDIKSGTVQTGTSETLQEKLARLKREQTAAASGSSSVAAENAENRKDIAALSGAGGVSKISSSLQQKAEDAAAVGVSSTKADLSGAESIADKLKRLKAEQQEQAASPKTLEGLEVKETLAEKLARLKSEAAASANSGSSGGTSVISASESTAEKIARLKGAAAVVSAPKPESPSSKDAGKETLQEKLDRLKREQSERQAGSVAEKLTLMRSSGVSSPSAAAVSAASPAPAASAVAAVALTPAAPTTPVAVKPAGATTVVADDEYEYEEVSEEGSEDDDEGPEAAASARAKNVPAIAPVAIPSPVVSRSSSSAVLDKGREKAIDYKRWVADALKPSSDVLDFDKIMSRSAEMCAAVKVCFVEATAESSKVCANMDELHESLVEALSKRKAVAEAEAEERKRKREAVLRGMEEAKLNAEQARHKRTLRTALMQKCQLIIQWIATTSAELKKARAQFPLPADGEAAYLKAAPEVEELLNRLRESLKLVVAEVEEARVLYDDAPAGDVPAESGAALIDGQTKHAEELIALHQQQFAALHSVILETELASHVEGLSKWCAGTYSREDLFDDALCASISSELEARIARLEDVRGRCGPNVSTAVDVASFRVSMKNFLAERSSLSQKKKMEENVHKVEAEALCAAFLTWVASAAGSKPADSLRSASVEEVEEALEAHEIRMKEILSEGKEKIAACKTALRVAQKQGVGKLAYTEDGLDSRMVELTSLLKRRTSSLQRLMEEAIEREKAEKMTAQGRVVAVQAWENGFVEFQKWLDSEQPRLLTSTLEDESQKVTTELREKLAHLQSLWDAAERLGAAISDRTMLDAKFLGEKLSAFLMDREKRLVAFAAGRTFSGRVGAFVDACREKQKVVESGEGLPGDELELELADLRKGWNELLGLGMTDGAAQTLKDAEAAKRELDLAVEQYAGGKDAEACQDYERIATHSLRLMRAATEGMTLLDQRQEGVSWESVLVEASFEVEKVLSFVNQCERDALTAWTALETADGKLQKRANPPFRVVQEAALEFREVARRKLALVEASVQTQTRRAVAGQFQRAAGEFLAWIDEQAASLEHFNGFGGTVEKVDEFLAKTLPVLDEQVENELSVRRSRLSKLWEEVRSCGVLGTADEPLLKWHDCVEREHKLETAKHNRAMAAKVARSALLLPASKKEAPELVPTMTTPAAIDVILKERQLERAEKKSKRASIRLTTDELVVVVAEEEKQAAIVEEEVEDEEEVIEIVEEIVEVEEEPLANFLAGDVQFEDADLLDVFANIELDDLLKSVRHSAPVREYFSLPAVLRRMVEYLQSGGDLSKNMLADDEETVIEEVEEDDESKSEERLPAIPAVVPGLPPPDELIERIGSPEDMSEVLTFSTSAGSGLTLQRTKVYILELFMNPLSGVVTEALCASDDVMDVLFSYWKKDPLVESMEDKNTLDLMSKIACHIVTVHPRSFFRKLLNSPWLKTRLMDLFHVKEVGDVLRIMLEKESEVIEDHRELGWSRDCLVPFVLKKLERGLAERVDVVVVDSCEYLAHLVLTNFRSKQYLVLEVLQSLSLVTSAFLDENHYYQPELFALFFALVPNKQELSESSVSSSEWESEQHQQSPRQVAQYPSALVEFLTSASLSDQLRTILTSQPPSANRLGVQRWRASQVVCCMVGTLHPEVVDVLISSGNLALVLDLFFSLPQSSMMHSMILDAIRFMLHHSARLRHWLLVVYKFVQRVGSVFEKQFDRSELPTRMFNSSVHHLGHLYDAFCEVRAVQAEQSQEELEASQGWDGFGDLLASITAIEKLLELVGREVEEASRDEVLDEDTEQMLAAALLEEMMESEVIMKDTAKSNESADAFAEAVLAAAVAADSSIKDEEEEKVEVQAPPPTLEGVGRKRSWSARRQKLEQQNQQREEEADAPPPPIVDGKGAEAVPIAILSAPSSTRRSWRGRHVGSSGAMKELEGRYGEPKLKLSDSMELGGYGNSPFPLRMTVEEDQRRDAKKDEISNEDDEADAILAAAAAADGKGSDDETDAILAAAAAADGKGSDDETDAILAAAAAADGKGSDDETDAILAAAAAADGKGSDDETDAILAAAAAADGKGSDDETDAILAAAAAEDSKRHDSDDEADAILAAAAAEDPKRRDSSADPVARVSGGEPGGRRSWKTHLVQRQSKSLDEIESRYSGGQLGKRVEEETTAPAEPEPIAQVSEGPRRSWKERAAGRQSGSLSELAARYKNLGKPEEAPAPSDEPARRSWRDKSNQKTKRSSVEMVADDGDSDAIVAAAMAEDKALQALVNTVAVSAKPDIPLSKRAELQERLAAARAALEADKSRMVELQQVTQARLTEMSKLEADKQSTSELMKRLHELGAAKQVEADLLLAANKELELSLSAARDEENLIVSRDRLAAGLQEERRNNAKLSEEITSLSERRAVLERDLAVQRSKAESAEAARRMSMRNAEEQEREQKRLRQEIFDVETATKDMAAREPKLRSVMEQEVETNKAELEDLTKDYTTEIEKLKERVRVANAMRILQQKRESAAKPSHSVAAATTADAAGKVSGGTEGEEVRMECPSCATVVKKKGAKFCPKCRTALAPAVVSAPVLTTPVATESGEAKKVVVGRRASMNLSAKEPVVPSQAKKSSTQRAKDPRRAPVTMQSLQGLMSAHQPCLMCSWYNPVGAEACGKCGARLKE